jgi:hypothetical protein
VRTEPRSCAGAEDEAGRRPPLSPPDLVATGATNLAAVQGRGRRILCLSPQTRKQRAVSIALSGSRRQRAAPSATRATRSGELEGEPRTGLPMHARSCSVLARDLSSGLGTCGFVEKKKLGRKIRTALFYFISFLPITAKTLELITCPNLTPHAGHSPQLHTHSLPTAHYYAWPNFTCPPLLRRVLLQLTLTWHRGA